MMIVRVWLHEHIVKSSNVTMFPFCQTLLMKILQNMYIDIIYI